jgi:hypothetical protein
LSVTNSLIQVENSVYLNLRAYLFGAFSYSGENLALIANIVDYKGSDPSSTYTVSEAYPIDDSYLWTQNTLTYYYNGSQTEGYVLTNTSWYSDPIFGLDSLFYLNFVDADAYFMVYETLYGNDGLDAWGAAEYNLQTGMIADIAGEVSYADKLIFGANTAYDMQLQSYVNPLAPTKMPTAMPTTSTPTESPSAPTAPPTFAPSVTPGYPTTPPTERPTTAPTASPTLAPTMEPTTAAPSVTPGYPTTSPTERPTAAPTAPPTHAPTMKPSTAAPSVTPGYPTMNPTVEPFFKGTPRPLNKAI